MTRLIERKTRISMETSAMVPYRGAQRAVIVEPDEHGHVVTIRLKGTRVRYETSWEAIFHRSAAQHADRLRAERQKTRQARKRGAA